MKTFFTIVAVLVASVYAAPEAEADPHRVYGAHGYGYGRPHYLGKRDAEPTADPEADPHHGYYGYPSYGYPSYGYSSYGHGSYGSYGFRPHHFLGKREAEPTADPGHGYASSYGYGGHYGRPSYGYGRPSYGYGRPSYGHGRPYYY
ncbi:unnamed protein product [Lepeophtheirus salmonis]|uniref:(salmon louse) hypothetical protein n=1 Tax=Lepeophtheirus salmonis TaxID=72036 RepID=A0A7R8CVZ8_LEPSM|nr:unnamed protein product [Lepeophtheirus salmonis]CAF2915974.1 unnamed protein product [Lepeophtheirus salmonis]